MKKKPNRAPENRIDLAVIIITDNDVDLIISLSNPQDFHIMNQLSHQEQEELARHIALALDDMDALPLHQKLVRKHPQEVLLAELEYVLAKPRKDITSSRAAYYNYLIRLYERTGKYHSRD